MTYNLAIRILAAVSTAASIGLGLLVLGGGHHISTQSMPWFIGSLSLTPILIVLASIAINGVKKTVTDMASTTGRVASAVGAGVGFVLEVSSNDDDSQYSHNDTDSFDIGLNWDTGRYEVVGIDGDFDENQ